MEKAATSPTQDIVPTRDEALARARQWSRNLLDGPITYFPVRHHSPACSRVLSAWIQEHRPESIVIEGPCSQDEWIPSLASDECVGPVAILTTYQESTDSNAPRHSAFYPLCDYSPEWVALREGIACKARVRFADMEFADRVRHRRSAQDENKASEDLLGVMLADESHLRQSQFIKNLTRRLGCRDFDELWDHLFESRVDRMSAGEFVGLLATYCDLSRASHLPEALQADATLAREAVMVDVIRAEQKRLRKPTRRGAILVVTGGFHTVALADAVAAKGNPHLLSLEPIARTLVGNWLIRYSYPQLDALAGYRSGMPNPGFYDSMWRAQRSSLPAREAVARLVTAIARETRGKPIPHESSVTDSIAATRMVEHLADLRGHSLPSRADLLDAISSCMRKESAVASDILSRIVHNILAGDRIGSVPASAKAPPIIDDFQRLAATYKLPIDTIESRTTTLELYRKPPHRLASFFLHQLQLLEVPYASFVDGPDFIHGYRLGKLQEEWQVGWNPGTDARLAELATLGDTVANAAALKLLRRVAEMEEHGASRNVVAAVELLIRTCRCGLHGHSGRIVRVVESHIAEDPSFASVAGGLSQLSLLQSAREPLNAVELNGLPAVMLLCYQRACFLIGALTDIPDDQVEPSLDGLLSMRELLNGQAEERTDGGDDSSAEDSRPVLDATLFIDRLSGMIRDRGKAARSEIAGAAAGVLYGFGRMNEDQVCDLVARYLDAAVDDVGAACGVIRGLLTTAREVFWRMDALLRRIDLLFQQWEENRFVAALPHMRLAFSQLSPKEIDSVAGRVAAIHQVDEIGPLIHPDVGEEEIQLAVQVAELMHRSLREDGLQ